jgi:RsiW-degrading membrane proteinase PrsW (M82 family)
MLPVILFYWLFRKNWVDNDLKKVVVAGFFAGIICVYMARLIYLPIEWFIGNDMRSFISEPREWWITLLASVGIIGVVEEAIKAAGALLVIYLLKFNKRSTIVFMAFAGVAAGFSLFENIQYYVVFGSSVVLPRIMVSSCAHIFFSCVCAALVAIALNRPKSDSVISLRILVCIGLAALLHGLFDYMVFSFHLEALAGILASLVALFSMGIYESWIAVLRIDNQKNEGLMICSGCGAFSIGRARFCNFCGGRVVLSRRDFTLKMAE